MTRCVSCCLVLVLASACRQDAGFPASGPIERGAESDPTLAYFPRLTLDAVHKLEPEVAKAILVARAHIETRFEAQDWPTELRFKVAPLKDGWEIRALQFAHEAGVASPFSNVVLLRVDTNWRLIEYYVYP